MAGNEGMILYHRRALTTQSMVEERVDQGELAGTMRVIRDAIPGTQLPEVFPFRAQVVAAGYSAVEDLQDATEDELAQRGLTRRQARAVLAACAAP